MPQGEKLKSKAMIETIIILVPKDKAIISMLLFSFLANKTLLKTYPGRNEVEKSPKNIRICLTRRSDAGIMNDTKTVTTEKITTSIYHNCSLILFRINSDSPITIKKLTDYTKRDIFSLSMTTKTLSQLFSCLFHPFFLIILYHSTILSPPLLTLLDF